MDWPTLSPRSLLLVINTQILTPVSWVLLIEKANLCQKHSLAVVSQICGLHWNQTPSVPCQLLTCGCCFWIFHAGPALKHSVMHFLGNRPPGRRSWWNPWDVTFWNGRNQAESCQRNQAQRKIPQRSSMKAPCGFFEMFWPSLISWSALTLSGVRCELHKQSRLTFFKSQSEIHDGIGRSSRSPAWKHRVAFSRFTLDLHRGEYSTCQLLSSTLTFTDVLIGIDLVRGKMWPSETIIFWLSSKSIENRTESGGTYQRNQA